MVRVQSEYTIYTKIAKSIYTKRAQEQVFLEFPGKVLAVRAATILTLVIITHGQLLY